MLDMTFMPSRNWYRSGRLKSGMRMWFFFRTKKVSFFILKYYVVLHIPLGGGFMEFNFA